MEKIFAEFKEDLIKVGNKVVNNVVDFYLKEVETNVVEQKCPFKDVDKNKKLHNSTFLYSFNSMFKSTGLFPHRGGFC